MHRIACSLIGASLTVVCALVALLLSDALSPGRLPPMLAFWGACGAGGMLIAGLMMLERTSRDRLVVAGPDFSSGRA